MNPNHDKKGRFTTHEEATRADALHLVAHHVHARAGTTSPSARPVGRVQQNAAAQSQTAPTPEARDAALALKAAADPATPLQAEDVIDAVQPHHHLTRPAVQLAVTDRLPPQLPAQLRAFAGNASFPEGEYKAGHDGAPAGATSLQAHLHKRITTAGARQLAPDTTEAEYLAAARHTLRHATHVAAFADGGRLYLAALGPHGLPPERQGPDGRPIGCTILDAVRGKILSHYHVSGRESVNTQGGTWHEL